jgi:hypothetical protein
VWFQRATHGSAEQRVQWFRLGIESGDLKQCDTFFKNLLPAQICASSGSIDGSVELHLDYFRLPIGIRWSVYRKSCLMLVTVFLGFSPVVRENKGGEKKMRPVRVKWTALPLCAIGFDRKFDFPIALFYCVSPLWIAALGGEGP